MTTRAASLIALLASGILSIGCAGSADEEEGSAPDPVGRTECTEEEADVPGNNCFPDMADPCANPLSTNYRGDEYCIDPPKNGFQMRIGPTSYDDPEELDRWTLPPGGYPADDPRSQIIGAGPDVNWCYYMKTPNTEDVFTKNSFSRMRPGSHHYIMFALPPGSDVADSTEPQPCGGRNGEVAGGANFISGATRSVQNIAMFGDAPEDEGMGSLIPARTQVNQNLHFVNISDEPVLQEVWINHIEIPAEEVTNRVRAVTWYGGLGMNIPYGAHQLVESSVCSAPADIPELRLLGATAHAHANTLRVSMHRIVDGQKELIFDDYDWNEPTVWRWNSTIQNPRPDAEVKRSGSPVNGVITVRPGDQFSWECEVINNSPDRNNLVFSDKAYSGEMCNVFGMYAAPNAERPWTCFSVTGGKPIE